jgi:hypothetical protein
MGWRIELRICSVPSVSWYFRPAVFVLFAVSLGWAQAPGPANVRDCRPCSFSPGTGFPTYSFTFDLKQAGNERAVAAIEIARERTTAAQRLTVAGSEPIANEEDFFFGGVDLDFDGFLDLMLITRRGIANAYAAYWLFDPKTGRFEELGAYPVFRIDAQKRLLSTYERGGSAGLIHESRDYAFVNGRLTLMREEKQDATPRAGVFRKVIRERVGNTMKVLKTETVRAPQ